MQLKKQHGMPTSPVMERLPDLSGLAPADKDTLAILAREGNRVVRAAAKENLARQEQA